MTVTQLQAVGENVKALELVDSLNPSRALPGFLARLLPDPMRSLEDWQRYQHLDIEALGPADRSREAFALQQGLALLYDHRRAPRWALDRIARLDVGRGR